MTCVDSKGTNIEFPVVKTSFGKSLKNSVSSVRQCNTISESDLLGRYEVTLLPCYPFLESRVPTGPDPGRKTLSVLET